MVESDFAIAIKKSIEKAFPGSFVWRPHDGYTLGLPDVMAVMRDFRPYSGDGGGLRCLAVEVKQLQRFLDGPFTPGRRTAPLLHHPFTGPQISTMNKMAGAGVEVWGLVQVTAGAAFRIRPENIPKEGNFTHEELVRVGTLIERLSGMWAFWH